MSEINQIQVGDTTYDIAGGGTKVVTVGEGQNAKTSLQAVTNLSPSYVGNTRGNGAVDLQQARSNSAQVASGNYSVVMGSGNTAIDSYSVAMGYGNTASSITSVALGYGNTASGAYSVAMGDSNTASGTHSVAMGDSNTASSNYSVSMGDYNTASGYCSVAMGDYNTASGYCSVAMGYNNTASGSSSVAVGYNNTAIGDYSVATGKQCRISIPGVVANNTVEGVDGGVANRFGHAGFKGFSASGNYIQLLALSNTDILVARIDVIFDTGDLESFFVSVKNSSINSCSPLIGNAGFSVNNVVMDNGYLCFSNVLERHKQIGIFYTLYSDLTNGGGGGDNGSSYGYDYGYGYGGYY